MGGGIGMILAAEQPDLPLAGVAAVAPAVCGDGAACRLCSRLGLWLSAHTIPWYPLTGQGLKVQASDNIAMLRRLAKDKQILRQFRVDLVWGLVDTMDRAMLSASRIRQPSLFLYGLRDELVPLGPTRRTLLTVPQAKRRVAVYPNGYHMLLRDLRGAEVVADLAVWLLNPSAPLPSGADRSGIEALLARSRALRYNFTTTIGRIELMVLWLGCIADDFTGATDMASMLVKGGLRTVQTIGVPPDGFENIAADAVVVALKTRSIPAEDAVAQSLEALAALRKTKARRVFLQVLLHFRFDRCGQYRSGRGSLGGGIAS